MSNSWKQRAPILFLSQQPKQIVEQLPPTPALKNIQDLNKNVEVQDISSGINAPEFLMDDRLPYGEDERTEFKASFHPQKVDHYRRTINAFLNTSGGRLIFGIDDNGIVRGVPCRLPKIDGPQAEPSPQKALDTLKLWVDNTQTNFFVPALNTITVKVHKITRDLWIWIVVVPKYSSPVYYNKTIYQRLNASTVVQRIATIVSPEDAKECEQRISTAETTIQKQSEEIQQCLNRITDQKKLIADQKKLIDDQEQAIQQKDTLLQEKDTLLQEKDTLLQEKEASLLENQDRRAAFEANLDQKEIALLDVKAQLWLKEIALREKEMELLDKETILKDQAKRLQSSHERTTVLEQMVADFSRLLAKRKV
jgi:hypothetical protein